MEFLPLLLPSLCLPERVPGEILKYEKICFWLPSVLTSFLKVGGGIDSLVVDGLLLRTEVLRSFSAISEKKMG